MQTNKLTAEERASERALVEYLGITCYLQTILYLENRPW